MRAFSTLRGPSRRGAAWGNPRAIVALGVAFGPVMWSAVLPLGAGCLLGGRLGPVVVRRAPAGPLRALIACGGIALAIHLGVDAYR